MRMLNLFFKRLFDFFGSLIGIAVLSPLFLIIALAVKVSSAGTVLFRQERLGRNGRTFRILKFRTMIVNAENIGDGLKIRSERDPRITGVGRILRATSLDELPQLFNVLCGTMSLVGPRPPVTYHPYNGYENYPEWAKKRFRMRPGITGLAQVRLRNSVSWDERIKVDNQYVSTFNTWLDVKILFLTIARMFKRQNIYFDQQSEAEKNTSTKG